MAEDFDFSSGLIADDTQIKNELAQMRQKVNELAVSNNQYAKQDKAFTDLRATDLQVKNMTATDRLMQNDVDALYGIRNENTNPLDHPSFDQERADNRQTQINALQKNLQESLSMELLPAKGDAQFTAIARDAQDLRALYKKSVEQKKPFGDIWLENVDTSELSYIDRTKLNMQARAYELGLSTNKTWEEIDKQVQEEFKQVLEPMLADPVYSQLAGVTPAALNAVFERSSSFNKQFQQNTALIGTVTDVERAGGKAVLGIAEDMFVSFIPVVGNAAGAYMAATGDDVVVNTITGEDEKLPWWARGLMALPVIGPAWRGGKALTKATKGMLEGKYGKETAAFIMKGGVNRTRAAFQKIANSSSDIDHLLKSIDNGEILLTESDEMMVQILRGVTGKNKGTSAAILNRKDLIGSPVADLAKDAVITGDVGARQKITQLIMDVSDNQASRRAQKIISALGVDSDGLQLLLKDARAAQRPLSVAKEIEAQVLEHTKTLAKQRQRLAALEKARQVKADKLAVAKATEDRAKEAPAFEDITTNVAPLVEEAKVGENVVVSSGEQVKVVEQTPAKTTVIDSKGTVSEVSKGLTADQQAFIAAKVRQLGSLEKVQAWYTDESPVTDYAIKLATELFQTIPGQVLSKTGEKVVSFAKLARIRQQITDIRVALGKGEPVMTDLDNLIQRISDDIKAAPDHPNVARRQALLEEMQKLRQEHVGAPLPNTVKPTPAAAVIPSALAAETTTHILRKGAGVDLKAMSRPDQLNHLINTNNRTGPVLEHIATSSEDPILRKIASRIRGIIPTVPIHVVTEDASAALKAKVEGAYGVMTGARESQRVGNILINGMDLGKGKTGLTDVTIIHESLHAATFKRLASIKKATSGADLALKNRLTSIQDAIKQYVSALDPESTDKIIIGGKERSHKAIITYLQNNKLMTSVDEMVAKGLTDPDAQEILHSIKMPQPETTLWTQFVEMVRDILKLGDVEHTALSELLASTDAVIGDLSHVELLSLEQLKAAKEAGGTYAPTIELLQREGK